MAFKASKYKHTLGKPQKKELWYPDLRPNGSATDATMIKTSAKFIAVNWTSASATLGILHLDQPGKRKTEPFLIHAHSGQLSDFEFSPFDDTVLATGADDARIKLWKIPAEGLTENLSSPQVDLSGHKKSVDQVVFNPTASNVLVSGSADKTVKLWDLEKAQEKAHIEVCADAVQGVAWNYDGSSIAVTSKDKKVRVIDPRSNAVISEGQGHEGLKAQKVVWLGNTPRILTTGFSKTRERQYAIWDAKNLSKPLKLTSLDGSTGVISPIFDIDTNIVYFGGNGDSSIRAFEITEDKNLISDLTTVAGDLPQKGVAWVPKRALDVMDTEIARILRLTQQAIVPVPFNVPRKSRIKWTDVNDLFPNTAGPIPAVTADEWFAGTSKPPVLINLDPATRSSTTAASAPSSSSSSTTTSFTASASPILGSSSSTSSSPVLGSSSTTSFSSPASSPALGKSVGSEGSLPSSPQLSSSGEPITRTGIVPKVVRSSKFRHILGKPVKKTQFYENAKPQGATSNTMIKANSKFFAVPWVGTGGPLAIIPHSLTGRLPPSVQCFEVGSTLLDFDLHPFDDHIAVTGDEAAHIKVWKIPEGGLTRPGAKNVTTPLADLMGHTRKLTTVNFHPSADNILFTTGADLVLKTWDIAKQACVTTTSGHTDLILGVSVSYQGDLIATTCRDKMMRIVDPRSGTVVTETQGHHGAKGSRVTWLGNKPNLFSVGFGKSSEREYSYWDSRNLSAPAITRTLDQLSGVITPHYDEDLGVMYLAGRGDGSIKMFEIVEEDPYVHYLTEYGSSVPQMGVAILPKQSLDVRGCEIARFLKVTDTTVEPIQMTVPRTRMEFFQDDIFPPTRAMKPAYSPEEWLSGDARDPYLESIQPAGMTPLSQAPAVEKKVSKVYTTSAVDNTPSKEQVMSKFYQQMMTFKEDESTTTKTPQGEGEGAADDEWD